MKTSEILLLGGAALAAYYLFSKNSENSDSLTPDSSHGTSGSTNVYNQIDYKSPSGDGTIKVSDSRSALEAIKTIVAAGGTPTGSGIRATSPVMNYGGAIQSRTYNDPNHLMGNTGKVLIQVSQTPSTISAPSGGAQGVIVPKEQSIAYKMGLIK